MKENAKNIILLIFIIFFAVFFGMTKGNDELNLDFKLPSLEEEFSYPIVASEYNGLYRNNASNGTYALVGKNSNGTYRIYFIYAINAVKNITLKLDNATVENGKVSFVDNSNINQTLEFGQNEFRVPKQMGMGNEQIEGYYLKTKEIGEFSMSEFKY